MARPIYFTLRSVDNFSLLGCLNFEQIQTLRKSLILLNIPHNVRKLFICAYSTTGVMLTSVRNTMIYAH